MARWRSRGFCMGEYRDFKSEKTLLSLLGYCYFFEIGEVLMLIQRHTYLQLLFYSYLLL